MNDSSDVYMGANAVNVALSAVLTNVTVGAQTFYTWAAALIPQLTFMQNNELAQFETADTVDAGNAPAQAAVAAVDLYLGGDLTGSQLPAGLSFNGTPYSTGGCNAGQTGIIGPNGVVLQEACANAMPI
jgi:hypothetical protein